MESQAFHGLEAYSGKNKPIHSLIRQALDVNAVQGEICTASRLVGKIGVLVDAVHTCAFNGDVYSSIKADGNRSFSPENNQNRRWFVDGMVEEKWSYDEKDWTREQGLSNGSLRNAGNSAAKNGRSYAEYFARSPSVRCVVFDSDAGQLIEKKARVLARALKTVAMPVSSVTSLENYQND